MKKLFELLQYVSRLAELKKHDPEIYEKLVEHVAIFAAITGSLATLWILAVIYLLKTL